jgi:drug/metabolite transporter (DMT)-like permease
MTPLMLAMMTTLGWALYHLFIKLSSEDIHPVLGYVFLNISSLSLGLIALSYIFFIKEDSLHINMKGGGFAIASGAAVLLAELSVFYLFSTKAPISTYVPIMSAGAAVIVVIAGLFLLGEKFDLRSLTGILFAIASIFLLSKA